MAYINRHKVGGSVYSVPLDKDKKPIGLRQFTRFSDGGFELNEFGYIRNDISQLLSVQNQLSFQRALQTFKSNQLNVMSFPPDMSHEDMIKELRPRWCQLPYQQRAFAEYLTEEKADQIRKDIEAYQEQIKQSASTTSVSTSVDPAPASSAASSAE